MSQAEQAQPEKENWYPLDVESGAEMVRLLDLNKFVTEAMGGLFPERSDVEGLFDALDIGCGPGGWVHEVAHSYPDIEVTGIDISQSMIGYAQAHAQVRGLTNAHFRVMNANRQLDFPAASFDLVNIRSAVGYIPPQNWPLLLAECKRILRAGGVIRWTEGEWGGTNMPAVEQLTAAITRVAHTAGLGFSPGGRSMGIIHMMARLLQDAGFLHIQQKAHASDNSYGSKLHAANYQDLKILVQTLQPLLVKMQIMTAPEATAFTEQVLTEMQAEEFCMVGFLLTTWGQKPT
jgi:ubiquinone/menaquinone biosynthesis C-methylase UbiE